MENHNKERLESLQLENTLLKLEVEKYRDALERLIKVMRPWKHYFQHEALLAEQVLK